MKAETPKSPTFFAIPPILFIIRNVTYNWLYNSFALMVGDVAMVKSRKAAVLVALILVMMLLFANKAHASGYEAAYDISSWFWCTAGYYEYC